MKRTPLLSLLVLPLSLATAAMLCSGCHSKPSDTQLAASVQSAVGADPALQGQPISVAAKDGAVTLTGSVNGQGLRELASKDAAKVSGVRTVVNDLAIGNAAAGAAAMENGNEAPVGPANNESAQNNAALPPPPPPPPTGTNGLLPPPPAAPQPMVVPAGARLRVRLGQTLSTKNSQTGDPFTATLVDSVRVNGQTVIPAGAQARGTIVEDKSPGRFKGAGILAIRLHSLRANGNNYPIQTSIVERTVQGKGKRSAVMTGGGAGLGAIIGGVAGGGKGALVGGLLGGGGGAAGSAFTGNKDLVLPAETILTFSLHRSVTVNP